MKELNLNSHFGVGIFSASANFKHRFIPDFSNLRTTVDHLRGLGLKIVLTQGTYDMVHIGHARYFEAAKEHGNILVVGVDSDQKVRQRKGPDRPVVPQDERLEMVAHMRGVDIVTVKEVNHPHWHLIKTVRPDILIASDRTKYSASELKQLKKYCGKVVVLPPMATTSTSAKLRLVQLGANKRLGKKLSEQVLSTIQELIEKQG
jgi:rfaE bifunctional protein nucleotidyltransferase chain/domain